MTDKQLSSAEAVADGNAVTHDIAGTELGVVVNKVQAQFGANESIMPEIRAQAGSHIAHEMVAAGIAGAANERVAVHETVEAKVFSADAGQYFAAEILGDVRNPDAIERPENRTIRLVSAMETLTRFPEQIAFQTEAMMD